MLAVQECYISVCKEKDMLGKEEAVIRVNEVLKCVYNNVGHGSYAQIIKMEKLTDLKRSKYK